MAMIDLRSDTVTRPSPAMRAAMAAAPVGDDQYGEDPAVNELQAEVAALLGKEAALFMASGTMANQVALKLFTRPGDDVIVSQESHAVWHEAGASGANAGVQFTPVGKGGLFTAADVVAAFKAPGHAIFPATTLVEVENTHNRGGGLVFPQAEVEAICATARKLGAATFLDGARLFNAATASGAKPAPSPRRSTWCRSPCRKGWARRSAACSPGARTTSRAPSATAACSAARCARPASSPPPAPTRCATISAGSARTTPMHG
jgi:threonine aldolase